MYADDHVAHALGIVIERAGPGVATVRMTVTRDMTNGLGVCHGGVVFTLADTAMAYASNAAGARSVSTSASIEWLRPARRGDELTAVSRVVGRRGRNTVHDVVVSNAAGEAIALVRAQTLTSTKESTP